MNPFEYIITENKKSLYIPYEYKHDIPFEEYRRSKSVIPNALKKATRLEFTTWFISYQR